MSLTDFSTHSNLLEREASIVRAIETGDRKTFDNELIQLDKIILDSMLYGDLNAIVEHRSAVMEKILVIGDRNVDLQIEFINDKALSISDAVAVVERKRHLKSSQKFQECVFQNLMKFRPWEVASHTKPLNIAPVINVWLNTGCFDLALPLLDEMLMTIRHPQELQTLIIDRLKDATCDLKAKDQPMAPLLEWARGNEADIASLNGSSMPSAFNMTLDIALDFNSAGLNRLARLIVSNSNRLPDQGDLFRLRKEADIIVNDDLLQSYWASEKETSRLSPGKLMGLCMYSMAFEDAPVPAIIQTLDPRSILQAVSNAMKVLAASKVTFEPTRIAYVLDHWWHTDDGSVKELAKWPWPEEFKMSCEGYRTSKLEIELGL